MIEAKLKELLKKTFIDSDITIINESHLHANHSSSPGTGHSHFKVIITLPKGMEKLSRLEKHRMANAAIDPLFDQGLHAISFTFKP